MNKYLLQLWQDRSQLAQFRLPNDFNLTLCLLLRLVSCRFNPNCISYESASQRKQKVNSRTHSYYFYTPFWWVEECNALDLCAGQFSIPLCVQKPSTTFFLSCYRSWQPTSAYYPDPNFCCSVRNHCRKWAEEGSAASLSNNDFFEYTESGL